ncbi:MAG: peptidoglycan DD-metalloendopeptidase family protein [Synergistaceae bacterium]|nr:peptidoglycan DD-metalloendopeptidase family protein [Synergistaceae bacterium]
MQSLEQQNNKLQNSVNELNKKIEGLNKSIAGVMKSLRARLLDIYKFTPEENNLSVFLTSEGPHEAVNTAYMLRRFAKQDTDLIEKLYSQQQELIASLKQLEESKSQLAAQANALKKKRAEYDDSIKKTDSLLKNVQNEQKKAETASRELEAAQKAVGTKINSLMKQKKNAQAKKANTQTQAAQAQAKTQTQTQQKAQSSGKKAATPAKPAPATNTSSPARYTGALSWPLNGTVTMQYGSRVHPTFKTKIFNSGIDIQAAAGTPVKAAGPGEVLYQGWLRGFGQVVIIDHGGDLSTVYAHLGGTSVREGASVKTGTVIGKVGNTGTDAKYGLHFEVRKNGSAQNPMNYLRR